MRTLLYALAAMLFLAIADWIWYQYWYHTARLAMTRTDGYHARRRGRCYTL